MPEGDANKNFRMGTWLVQPDLNRLSDGDRVVTLEPRVMGVLVCLARRSGKIVSADKLLDTVWHGRALVDNTIYQAVTHLRKALGDDIHNPRYIETIPKKGYRLICPVTPVAADAGLPEVAFNSSSRWRYRRRTLAIIAGIASIAVAIILIVNPELRGGLLSTNDGPSDRSVAVLPFVDMSEDGNQQYLSDGVAEELIHVLSNLPDLRVTARTSSFAFRNSNDDIREIGSKLNVATILEGSVRKDGDRIRVTSQLVDTRNGYHLWSQIFDRHSSDLFRIQNEIAVAVAKTFEYRDLDNFATDNNAAPQIELQTYDLYLLGLHHMRKDTPSGHMRAIEYFDSAIEKDPSFARAYAGLSESYWSRFWYEADQDLLEKAESAAEYALLLDDQSAEAFAALGQIKETRRDWSGAEAAFTKAVELNPNDIGAHVGLVGTYYAQGRHDDAHDMVENALVRHPISGELNFWMGQYHLRKGHRDWNTALEYFERAMEGEPNFNRSYSTVGNYYFTTGQLDQAIPYLRKVVDLTTGPTKIGRGVPILLSTYVNIGDYDSAAHTIRRMKELEPDQFRITSSEIQLQLARGDFSAARDIVHGMVSTQINVEQNLGWMAFYEMIVGDTSHAEEIYARLATAPEPDHGGPAVLYWPYELAWGMLGAVNLAYLNTNNGDTRAAQELLRKAREYIESRNGYVWFVSGIPYVLAQIAAVEGNNEVAIEYFRTAVDAGWTRAWFGRIDPIMADLRKDARYMQILDGLENKLLKMRESTKVLASN